MFNKTALTIVFALVCCSTFAATDPNNSGVNQRDVQSSELTSQDQGNSKEDIALTAKIRKAVVAQRDFSIDAKNIKIITADGTVTLKGPVKTSAEKSKLEKIAVNVAGVGKVMSQIEVE